MIKLSYTFFFYGIKAFVTRQLIKYIIVVSPCKFCAVTKLWRSKIIVQQNSTDLSYEEQHDVQGQASSRWANFARKEWPEGSGGDSLERRGNTTAQGPALSKRCRNSEA